MSSREIRYRRLLALYPDDFRREYGDEMLGVLMADPRPTLSNVTNLVAGAGAARFRETLGGHAWRRAAWAAQLFGAILLTAVAARRVVMIVIAGFATRASTSRRPTCWMWSGSWPGPRWWWAPWPVPGGWP